MAKSLVLTAGGKSVILPIKPLIVVEVSTITTLLAIGTAIGAVTGHTLAGFLTALAVVVVGEAAEFFIAKRAVKQGKLVISIKE
jgi:hypothetical protein